MLLHSQNNTDEVKAIMKKQIIVEIHINSVCKH